MRLARRAGRERFGEALGEPGAHVTSPRVDLRHRRHQVGGRFRLGHIPGGAGTQGLNGELPLRVHADDQHAHLGEALLQLPQQGEEPRPGHADIQDQHVRAASLELAQQIVPLGRLAHDL